jgi:hypothetical protein
MQTYIQEASGNYSFSPGSGFSGLNYADEASGVWSNRTWYGTFCIERNEYFVPWGVYNATISQAASAGGRTTGPNGTIGSDPISVGTEALYSNFALGTLDSYLSGFHYGNSTDAANVQNLIWYLEGEFTASEFGALGSNPFATQLLGYFGDAWGNAMQTFSGTSGVHVMTLTDSAGKPAQDQLVYLSVPDGGLTVMLLGLSFATVAIARRLMPQWHA